MARKLRFEDLLGLASQRVLPFDRLRTFKVLKWHADGESAGITADAHSMLDETDMLGEADIVTSQFKDSETHMAVLDIDVPAALVPSSTPGKHHLYISTLMDWETYERLLDAMADAGILEPGYVGASKARGFTAVRLPWVVK